MKLFMYAYLVFFIAYFHVLECLCLPKHVNFNLDLVHTWYPALWKKKEMYHFYEVYDAFVSSFKKLIFGDGTLILSLGVTTFLDKR
jgi:hypothetical protein